MFPPPCQCLYKETGERYGVCLKTKEKTDKDKEKKHIGKLKSDPDDGTLLYSCQI